MATRAIPTHRHLSRPRPMASTRRRIRSLLDSSIDPNIQARVGALGPAPTRSTTRYLALNTYSYLVPNTETTLPGSVCATCIPHDVAAANTWTPRALAQLVERLGGAVVAGHSQACPRCFIWSVS